MENRAFVPKNRCLMRKNGWRIDLLCPRIDAYAGELMENRSFMPENRCFLLEIGWRIDPCYQRID